MTVIRVILKFLLRAMFLPINLAVLGITAAIELSTTENWEFWKSHNEQLIKLLPWSSYDRD